MPDKKPETKRYNRIAWMYDFIESPVERLVFSKLRRELLSGLRGKVLEIGVGTGKNFPYYPEDIELTGIDISPKMLARARRRAERFDRALDLQVMDAENLAFPDKSFDFVVATFVYCSVTDPIKGLSEIGRVVKDKGTVLLLEHVRSENRVLGKIMDWLNLIVRAIMGPNINRRTVENVRKAGLEVVSVEDKGTRILKKIVARSS